MSYCRFGKDSDVYVIGTAYSLECCGCSMHRNSAQYRRYSQMLRHLENHKKNNELVPLYAVTRLQKEQKQHHDKYPATESGTIPKNVKKNKSEMLSVKLYKTLDKERKKRAKFSYEIFKKIYGRTPTQLEIPGLADAMDIKLELMFLNLTEKYK